MAIYIEWGPRIIHVPRVDMTLLQSSPEIRELNLDVFRLALKDLEDSDDGMAAPTTHNHVTTTTVGGVTLARVIELINNYTVTFEDGQYAVNLVGANSNVGDVTNVNQVSVRSSNSAGLIVTTGGETLTTSEIVSGLWNAVSSLYNSPGTMGAKLNSSASAGDPWGTNLPGPYPDGSAGYIVAKIGTEYVLSSGLTAKINLVGTDSVLSAAQQVLINKIGTDAILSTYQNLQLGLIGTSGIMPADLQAHIHLIGTSGVLSTVQNTQINKIGTDSVLSTAHDTQLDKIGTDAVLSTTQQAKINQIGTDNVLSAAQQIMLLEIYKIFGLDPTKPLIVSPSARTAGAEIQQVISGDPTISVTVQRV